MRTRRQSPPQAKSRIAAVAARLMAEDGIADYELAKRKAARQLGFPDTHGLPTTGEVESELRAYQALFQDEEQKDRLAFLRSRALSLMDMLEPFHPYLTGSVLDGTAGRYSEIDILLYADSAKDVEIFLLNQGLHFDQATPRHERAEAVLKVDWQDAVANLVVYPPQDERVTFRSRDGRVRERVRADIVAALLATETL